MSKKKDQYIQIGKCFKPHGIKGAFSLVLLNRDSQSLTRGSKVYLKPYNEKSTLVPTGEEHTIESIQYSTKVIFRLEGVDNRNEVESYIPFEIYVKREELPEIGDDEIYLEDLVGLSVKENDQEIGSVVTYYDHGASDILVIQLKDNSKIDIPFIDNFIKVIDIESGFIEIMRPEFL